MTTSKPQDSFTEQQALQRSAADTAEQAIVQARSRTEKWPEHRQVLTTDFASLLSEWRQKLLRAMTHVSFSPVFTALGRLQRMRNICTWHIHIWRIRVEIAGLWWRVHWLEIVAIAFVLFGLGIVIVALILLNYYLPNIQDFLRQLFRS